MLFRQLYAALKAAPHSLDGLTSAEAASPVQASVKKSDALHDIVNQVIKGTLPQNAATIAQLVDALKGQIETRGIDDRKFLLEHILVLLSSLPEVSSGGSCVNDQGGRVHLNSFLLPHQGSEFGSNLSNAFITLRVAA